MRYDDIAHNNGICVSGIYSITNTVNGKIYIGLTVDMYDRWRTHARYAGKRNRPLYNAIAKHGIENFDFQILEECSDRDALADLEVKYIEQYNTTVPNGYNLTIGGEGVVPATEEQRKASSDRMKAAWQDEAYRESQMAALNTEQHRQNQSAGSKARWADEEYRAKMSIIIKEALSTDSYKAKASANSKERWQDEAYREKMAAARQPQTEEARVAKSEAMAAYWDDPAFREERVARIKEAFSRPESRAKQRESMNKPEVKAKQSKTAKETWKKPETLIRMFFRKLTCGVTPSFTVGWERAIAKGVDPLVWYDWALNYYTTKYPTQATSLCASPALAAA